MGFINVKDEIERQESRVPWQHTGPFRYRPYFEKDHLFAEATVRRLTRENTSGMSIVSKAATAQWLINARLALELNEMGVHALIGTACSCGFGIELERDRGDKPITRADRERILFSLPGHLDTGTLTTTGLDLVRGVLTWPERQFWIQPAGYLLRTRWVCTEQGDLGMAVPREDGTFGAPPKHAERDNDWGTYRNPAPRVWTENQLEQLDMWREQAALKAEKAAAKAAAKATEQQNDTESEGN
jgi:hypothetical protein